MLPTRVGMDQLLVKVYEMGSPLAQRLWCGRRVTAVDGTGISMPDTKENQSLQPHPGHYAGGGAIFRLATRAARLRA